MHFGFYADGTETHAESLAKMNAVLANHLALSPADVVIDAGCGYGGSALWLAKNIGCHVSGVNIIPNQVEAARRFAAAHQLFDKLQFYVQDYSNTTLPDSSHTAFWALESLIHSRRKSRVASEASRLLKRAG